MLTWVIQIQYIKVKQENSPEVSNLFPFCNPWSMFPWSFAHCGHCRGHAVIGGVSSILSLGCVAVEPQLLAVVDDLPVPAHYVVCSVPGHMS